MSQSIARVLLKSAEAKRSWSMIDSITQDNYLRRIKANFSRDELRNPEWRQTARECLTALIGAATWE